MVGKKSGASRNQVGIGDPLRQARQQMHVTLPEAAAALNIPASQLAALEEGDFSIFAAEIYARGAYLKYAAYVGLDQNQTQYLILRALAAVRQRQILKVHTPYSWFERLVLPRVILVAAISSVGLVVGGYIIWQVQSYVHLPQLVLNSPTQAVMKEGVVTVEGKSESEVKVTVNGAQVLLRPDATFSTTLALHPGINIVRIEAENTAGRKRVIQRSVLWPRQNLVAPDV